MANYKVHEALSPKGKKVGVKFAKSKRPEGGLTLVKAKLPKKKKAK